jgi:hypothetical protein
VAEQLPPLMPGLFEAEDKIGTIHYLLTALFAGETLFERSDGTAGTETKGGKPGFYHHSRRTGLAIPSRPFVS